MDVLPVELQQNILIECSTREIAAHTCKLWYQMVKLSKKCKPYASSYVKYGWEFYSWTVKMGCTVPPIDNELLVPDKVNLCKEFGVKDIRDIPLVLAKKCEWQLLKDSIISGEYFKCDNSRYDHRKGAFSSTPASSWFIFKLMVFNIVRYRQTELLKLVLQSEYAEKQNIVHVLLSETAYAADLPYLLQIRNIVGEDNITDWDNRQIIMASIRAGKVDIFKWAVKKASNWEIYVKDYVPVSQGGYGFYEGNENHIEMLRWLKTI